MVAQRKTEARLVGAAEMAERLSLCTATIRVWARRGFIPAIGLPGRRVRWRFDAEEVIQTLKAEGKGRARR